MSRLLSLSLLATLLVGGLAHAASPEPEPASPPTPEVSTELPPARDPDVRYPWAAWLGGGFTMVMLERTPLGDQLNAAGYHLDVMGPALSLAIERHVLDWLVVGGSLDLRWVEGQRDHGRLLGRVLTPVDMGLWRVGAGAYVQPTVCLLYQSCRDGGVYFGALLGASAGPTLWTLRDVTEVGAFVRFDLALIWSLQAERFLLAFKVGHAMLWQSDMGPDALGHGFEWTPTIELQTGWRW